MIGTSLPGTPAAGTEGVEAAAAEEELGFEAAYQALGELVARLESGELPLEEAMALYERGVELCVHCGRLLEAAELRVRRVDGDGRDAGPLEG